MATMTPSRVSEVLAPERRAAWDEYRASTIDLEPDAYENAEPHAWARLQAKLDVIDARESALRGRRA